MPAKRTLPVRTDFERHKDTYRQEIKESISFIGQDLEFFTKVKVDSLLDLTRRLVGDPSGLRILDVGCGIGITDRHLTGRFNRLYGVDVSPGIVRKAKALNPKATYRHYNGDRLPFPSGSMDVTFAICVMHHVKPDGLQRFTEEMGRVTRKGGLMVIYEHNPLNPLTRVAVSRCEMDHDAILLRMGQVGSLLGKSGEILEKRYILFTPLRPALFRALDRSLAWLPLGAQYYVAARRPH
ncbi:MAG TPA: methyltransferase domain-containing protein [bacterium]|nr:methyltransferase domain-containing protein [bacterium]